MIRLFHVYFPTRTLVLSVLEVCLIVLTFLLVSVAYSANQIAFWLTYENGILKIVVVSATLMLCMYYFDLYDSNVLGNQRETLARLFQVFGTASVLLALLYFVFPEARLGRANFIFGIAIAGLALASSRHLFHILNRSGRLAERVVILGDGSLAISLAHEIEKRPELAMRLLRVLSPSEGRKNPSTAFRNFGGLEDLPEMIHNERITLLIVAPCEHSFQLPVTLLCQLEKRGLKIVDGATLYEKTTGKVLLDGSVLPQVVVSLGSWPFLILIRIKRCTSVIFSLLGLILCAPLMAVIALAVFAESDGPVLFCQGRVGKDRRIFTLYKFRSMRNEVARQGSFRPAQVDDERFTRLGRWLRRTHLDELPQLFNILAGDMNFVGPRPFALEEEEYLEKQIPNYPLRWAITPGATGWAQIQLGYCSTVADNTEKLAHDLFYLRNLSIGLDLLIVLRTTKVLLWGRGGR